VALNGTAIVVTDDAEKERLWNPAAGAWFDGPDDPELAVLHFDVGDGRYWDGPDGKLGRALALIRGVITGNDDGMGTSGPVAGNGEFV
jgi:general stress protein 26